LGWLSAAEGDEFGCLGEDEPEPPVPAGLGDLTPSLRALAEFLSIDSDLVEAAAELSPPAPQVAPVEANLDAWIAGLPAAEKDALLCRVVRESPVVVQREMLRRLRAASCAAVATPSRPRRTVAELLAARDRLATEKRRQAAIEAAREEARRREQDERLRQWRLGQLAKRVPETWRQVGDLIEKRQGKYYDEAVSLLTGLRDLAEREESPEGTAERIAELRETYRRGATFFL